MIVRECAPETANRQPKRKHERNCVEIQQARPHTQLRIVEYEEKKRRADPTKYAAERADVLPNAEDHPRIGAQLFREVKQDREQVGAENAAEKHPSTQSAPENQV